jgi:hypothetical protein
LEDRLDIVPSGQLIKTRKMTLGLVELIEEQLTREQWSPDQISGRLAKDGVAFITPRLPSVPPR